MFNFLEELSDTLVWPVSLNIPANGGKVIPVKFHAEFKRPVAESERELTEEVDKRAKKIVQRAKDYVSGETANDGEDDTFVKVNLYIRDQVLVSVGEVDKSGNYTAADSDKEARLLSLHGATEAILAAYGKSKSGEKAKN